MFVTVYFSFPEFSGANLEPKAWSFCETKSFGESFNQNHAGVLVALESCWEGEMPSIKVIRGLSATHLRFPIKNNYI